MNNFELKSFQRDAVAKLKDFLNERDFREIYMKAPTGSGKTIILLEFINQIFELHEEKFAFVWFTPGAGELEEQSQNKAVNFANVHEQSLDDAMLNGFTDGTCTFINYEKVIGRKVKVTRDGEKENLFDKIREAEYDDVNFIVIVDEAHRNKDTEKAQKIIKEFDAAKIIYVSATINPHSGADFYEVDELNVIESGLLTVENVVNEGIREKLDGHDNIPILLESADKKRAEIREKYLEIHKNINPLVLVQMPDESSGELLAQIEKYFAKIGKTYENKKLGVWLSEKKENIENIAKLDNPIEFLIIKQAIATGWDAPRAKTLVKIRANMGQTFTIQTIGRIRRMPEAKHYGEPILDNSFIYTFDEEFLTWTFGHKYASLPYVISRKEKCQVELTKEFSRNSDLRDDFELRRLASDFFTKKYHLGRGRTENREKLEGIYNFNDKIQGSLLIGQFKRMDDAEDLSTASYEVPVKYSRNRIDIDESFSRLERTTHLESSRIDALLKALFLRRDSRNRYGLLELSDPQYIAFVINNREKLKKDFSELNHEMSSGPANLFQVDGFHEKMAWKIPNSQLYYYNPDFDGGKIFANNAFDGYKVASTQTPRKSEVERLFENWISRNSDVEFWYKNGDKGEEFFSIVYSTMGGNANFYPDYIIREKSGKIWVVETKGGEQSGGDNKNIDEFAEAKFYALQRYSNENDVEFAFVRDRSGELFFAKNSWNDDMSDSQDWLPISEMF